MCRLTSSVKSFGIWRRGIETLKVGVGGGVHRYCNNRIQSINLKTMPTMPEILVLYCFACVKSMFTVVGFVVVLHFQLDICIFSTLYVYVVCWFFFSLCCSGE